AAPHPPAHPQPAANLQAILQAALHDHQRMAAAPQPARLAAAPAHLPPAAPRPRIQPVALPVHPRPTAPAIHATEVLARADAPVSRPTQFVGSALGMARVMTPTPAVGTVPYGGNR
ncbi:MAG: hypothetical protein KGQ40_12405, partial [Rhodospirillales bacterium]|nr:hypothetical protein [Rhodospirillales bacterium]